MFKNITNKEVLVVFKQSRPELTNKDEHEGDGRCVEEVEKVLSDLSIVYHMLPRSKLDHDKTKNKFIVSVGGDGTLLDVSHYCLDQTSPILGINSSPKTSIGALCAGDKDSFRSIMEKIYALTWSPTAISRLAITVNGHGLDILALNDILFCHKNPAALSRFELDYKSIKEEHRSSGMWIATAAGSTAAIYSCGAEVLPLERKQAIFRLREPYWLKSTPPLLAQGEIYEGDVLTVHSNMIDGRLFIDGPHKIIKLGLGDEIQLRLSDKLLWLFTEPKMEYKRKLTIRGRKLLHDRLEKRHC